MVKWALEWALLLLLWLVCAVLIPVLVGLAGLAMVASIFGILWEESEGHAFCFLACVVAVVALHCQPEVREEYRKLLE